MRITGGYLGGRKLKTAVKNEYRPAAAKIRQAIMSMLAARGLDFDGAYVLDLFAGTGSLGFESLSRGAAGAVFVEHDRELCRLIRENAGLLGLGAEKCRIHGLEVGRFLRQAPERAYDVIFIDPPYGRGLLALNLARIVGGGWLKNGGMLVAESESRPALDLSLCLGDMKPVVDRNYGQTRICLWENIKTD